MKKSQGRKKRKNSNGIATKVASSSKKLSTRAKKATAKAKKTTRSLLGNAKKKLNNLKKTSGKMLTKTKDKIVVTEEEIMDYVKKNPVKSASALALTTLIGGFIATRYKK